MILSVEIENSLIPGFNCWNQALVYAFIADIFDIQICVAALGADLRNCTLGRLSAYVDIGIRSVFWNIRADYISFCYILKIRRLCVGFPNIQLIVLIFVKADIFWRIDFIIYSFAVRVYNIGNNIEIFFNYNNIVLSIVFYKLYIRINIG